MYMCIWMHMCSVPQLCLSLYDPMDCSLLVSSLRGTIQERILERMTIFSSRGSFRSRDWSNPCLLCLLHWQVNSLPPSHLESPCIYITICKYFSLLLFQIFTSIFNTGRMKWNISEESKDIKFFFVTDRKIMAMGSKKISRRLKTSALSHFLSANVFFHWVYIHR